MNLLEANRLQQILGLYNIVNATDLAAWHCHNTWSHNSLFMYTDDSAMEVEPTTTATQSDVQSFTDSSSTRYSETSATLAGNNTRTTNTIVHIAPTSSVLYMTTSTVTGNPSPSLELPERATIGIVSGTVSIAVIMLALVLFVVICMRTKKAKRREAYGNRPNILRTLKHSDSFILLTSLIRLGRVTEKLKSTGRYSSAHRDRQARTSQSDTGTAHEQNTAIVGEPAVGLTTAELSRVSSIEMFENPSYSTLMVALCEGNDSPDFEERVYDVIVPVTAAPGEYEIPQSLQAEHESHTYNDADITYAEIQ